MLFRQKFILKASLLCKSKPKWFYFSLRRQTNSSVDKAGLYSQVIPYLSLQDEKTLNKIEALDALQIITPVPSWGVWAHAILS